MSKKKKKSNAKKGGHSARKEQDLGFGMFDDMSEEELSNEVDDMIGKAMTMLLIADVTPDQYSEFYKKNKVMVDVFTNKLGNILGYNDDNDEPGKVAIKPFESKEDDGDWASKSLVLKIQMKGVTKPPYWREIVIPATMSFHNLHMTIMKVTNLENCHLYQFGPKAYGGSFHIKEYDEDDYMFNSAPSYDPIKTKLYQFLGKKGDKLEYVYDFGDDWMFTITVQEVVPMEHPYPVCTKFKCDIDPMEDSGGVYAYLSLRNLIEHPEDVSEEEKERWLDMLWADTIEDFVDGLDRFDLVLANEELSEIKL